MKLCYFDLETTSLDTQTARIVEITISVHDGEHIAEFISELIDPGVPIPAEATKVHGITAAGLEAEDAQPFSLIAAQVQEVLDEGVVLVGYSSRRFDTVILDAELQRAGYPGLAKTDGRIDVPEIDLFEVWRQSEARSLIGAAKRFADVELDEGAHRSEPDTRVLPEILLGMMRAFGIESSEDAMEVSVPPWSVDRDGKFKRREDGKIVFAFGKNRDQPAAKHQNYLEWMLKSDFSPDTKSWIREFLGKLDGQG